MTENTSKLDKMVAELQQERDELRVKMQLAKQEIRDSWEPIEARWDKLEGKLRSLGATSGEAGKDVLAASSLLLSEIADGYKQIWKQLKR